jgi:eukaryotic-like serine/threonine-protein kinase
MASSSDPQPAYRLYMEVNPGDVLAGKYRVDRVIGAGGMGVVVQATHLVLQDRVAVKFLLPAFVQSEALTARFLREAQAAVRIKSPHVARVTDVGTLESGAPYMVMELLEGRDLGKVLHERGWFEPQQAAHYAMQVCEALAAAHAHKIVHRDVKPGNLFVTHAPDGSELVKVLDFGISKIQDAVGADNLTHTNSAIGSPTYMAPEQMRSAKTVDARADVWSLGVVLFEMLTGTLPYVADSMTELVALVLEAEAPLVRSIRPQIPQGLEAAVAGCLKKDPSERYQSVAELAAVLGPFSGPGGIEAAQRVRRILNVSSAAIEQEQTRPATPEAMEVIASSATQQPPTSATRTSFGRTDPKAQNGARRAIAYATAAGGVAVACAVAIWAVATRGAADRATTSAGLVGGSASQVTTSGVVAPTPASAQPSVPVASSAAAQAPEDAVAPSTSAPGTTRLDAGHSPAPRPNVPGGKTKQPGSSVFDTRQ